MLNIFRLLTKLFSAPARMSQADSDLIEEQTYRALQPKAIQPVQKTSPVNREIFVKDNRPHSRPNGTHHLLRYSCRVVCHDGIERTSQREAYFVSVSVMRRLLKSWDGSKGPNGSPYRYFETQEQARHNDSVSLSYPVYRPGCINFCFGGNFTGDGEVVERPKVRWNF